MSQTFLADQGQAAFSGIKRRVTQDAINFSRDNANAKKVMREIMQESSSGEVWNMKSSDNFFNTKTLEVSADPTSLSNDEIVFRVKSGDRFLLANTLKFNLKIKMQKYVTNAWTDVPASDKLIVLNGAIMNMLREEILFGIRNFRTASLNLSSMSSIVRNVYCSFKKEN